MTKRLSSPESQVTRWEWGKNLYDLRPWYAERLSFSRIGPINPPADPKGFSEYGFDAQNRFMIVKHHVGGEGERTDRYAYRSNKIEVEHLPALSNVPVTKSLFTLDQDRVVSWEWKTMTGTVKETYLYQDDRVVEIRSKYSKDPLMIYRMSYDGDRLIRIDSREEGRKSWVKVFEPPALPKHAKKVAEKVKKLLSEVENLLVTEIMKISSPLSLETPAYGLLLVYQDGYDALPPEIAIGLEEERRRFITEETKAQLPEMLWSPEDLTLFDAPQLELASRKLHSLCERVKVLLRAQKDPEQLRAVLVRVAKRLNEASEKLKFPRTKDFVVLVIGLDEGLRKDVSEYVPKRLLQTLNKKGYLPSVH